MKKLWLLPLLALFALSGCGFEIVDTGHRGVKTSFGEVDLEAGSLPEGWHWYVPFQQNIVELDVRTQQLTGTTNTYTKDVQQADIQYVANFRLQPDKAHLIYRDVGWNWQEQLQVQRVIEGVMKQVIGQYNAELLIANRQEATDRARARIAEEFAEKGLIFQAIELVDISYRPDFEKAVEDKVTAVQRAIEEENRTRQIEEQAKQQIIRAKAEAESIRIRANALAQNQKLVEWEQIQMMRERWDGKLPQWVMGGGMQTPIPFFQIPVGNQTR
jgi:regulator of protease activity HflC (stomatin/prohibitin superfamily)